MPDDIAINSPKELVDFLDELRVARAAASLTKKRVDAVNAACVDYIMANDLQKEVLPIETTAGTHEARLVIGQRSSGFEVDKLAAKDVTWLRDHQALTIKAASLKTLEGGAVDAAKQVQTFGETKTITFTEVKG